MAVLNLNIIGFLVLFQVLRSRRVASCPLGKHATAGRHHLPASSYKRHRLGSSHEGQQVSHKVGIYNFQYQKRITQQIIHNSGLWMDVTSILGKRAATEMHSAWMHLNTGLKSAAVSNTGISGPPNGEWMDRKGHE